MKGAGGTGRFGGGGARDKGRCFFGAEGAESVVVAGGGEGRRGTVKLLGTNDGLGRILVDSEGAAFSPEMRGRNATLPIVTPLSFGATTGVTAGVVLRRRPRSSRPFFLQNSENLESAGNLQSRIKILLTFYMLNIRLQYKRKNDSVSKTIDIK